MQLLSRRRAAIPLVILVLVPALGACRLVQPDPLVVPGSARVQGAEGGFLLTITNVVGNGSDLAFTITSESPRLSALPSSGILAGGESETISVVTNRTSLDAPLVTELLVQTNVGDNVVVVELLPRISACDAVDAALHRGPAPAHHGAGAAAADSARAGDRVPGEILVTYRAGGVAMLAAGGVLAPTPARASLSAAVATMVGARVARQGVAGQPDLLVAAPARVDEVIARLEADPLVRRAAANVYVERFAAPNDPYYPAQWNLRCFGIEGAWEVEDGSGAGADVIVSVIDDGLNVDHIDFVGKTVPGWNVVGANQDVSTSQGHGTHVSSLAAATGDNLVAVAGVGRGDRIHVQTVKIFADDSETTTLGNVIDGMRWAAGLPVDGAPPNDTPADVINMSLGFPSASPSTIAILEEQVDEVRQTGALIVAASGNGAKGLVCASPGVQFPARLNHVVGVGSVDFDMARSCFSDFGPGVDLMAPGGIAPSDNPSVGADSCPFVWGASVQSNTGVACMAGTSMAAPFVSGVAALLIASDESLRGDPDAIRALLLAATHQPVTYSAAQYGAGVLCPDAALGAALACGR